MRTTSGLLLEYVNERSLADACLSGDKNGLSLAPQSAGETDVKFSKGGLATDDSLCAGPWERGAILAPHRAKNWYPPPGKVLIYARLFGSAPKHLPNPPIYFLNTSRF